MYCRKCGKDYPKDKKVCKVCGIALTPGQSPGNKEKGRKSFIIISCVVLAVFVITFLVVGLLGMIPQPLRSTWYDQAGVMGTLEFKGFGVVTRIKDGIAADGSYWYNSGTKEGGITLADGAYEFTCDGETLTLGETEYTHGYKQQQ